MIRRVAVALAAFALTASPGGAQEEVTAEIAGTVRVGSGPLPGATVVIHRVDRVDAGEFDSIRTDAEGRFTFRLPRVPDPGDDGEVWFGSVRHQGLLYFGRPITTVADLDSAYVIQAWDTLVVPSDGATLPLTLRYMLFEQVETGWSVTDLLQLRVDGDRSLVPAEDGVTWSYPLPPGVSSVQVAGGDLAPAATSFEDGRISVAMALSPGARQIAVTYLLPDLNVEIPMPGPVDEVEVLVREPAPPMDVSGLTRTEPIATDDGAEYRRFVGVQLADPPIRLTEGEPDRGLPVQGLAVILALVLGGVGVLLIQRRAPAGTTPLPVPPADAPRDADVRDRLLLAIASLDEEWQRTDDAARRERIAEERSQLLVRLREISQESL